MAIKKDCKKCGKEFSFYPSIKNMVYDVITFNGEHDLFDIRYNILSPYVDEFIVVEFDKTFSGKWKSGFKGDFVFKNYPKVKKHINTEKLYGKYEDLARSSPNTEYGKGAEHWIREFCQKESIKDCLTHLKDDDMVFIGDVDEVIDLGLITPAIDFPFKAKLRVYSYFLNNRSSEEFWGTLVTKYGQIKDKCLNHLRFNEAVKIDKLAGWHFTSMGGYEKVKNKLEDSYTKETYANDQVMQHLEENIKNNKDFLGRDFKYWVDESEWPQYLKDNKERYKYLLKL